MEINERLIDDYAELLEQAKKKNYKYFLTQEKVTKLPESIWDKVYDYLFDTDKDHVFMSDEEDKNYHLAIHEFAKRFTCNA